jgi:hypothetical protein
MKLLRMAFLAGVLLTALAPASSAAPPASAAAPASAAPVLAAARAEIMTIWAAKDPPGKGSIDARIARFPHLKKKPFSDYSTFKVLGDEVIPLVKGQPASYGLVTGRTLRVTLRDVTSDKRFAVDAAIDQPGKPEYLKLLEVVAAPNEPFFVGGQSYQGGTLILAITLTS